MGPQHQCPVQPRYTGQGRAALQANGGHLCQPSQKVLCLSIGSKDASFSSLQFHIRGAQQALHAASLTLLSQVSRPPSQPGDALEVHVYRAGRFEGCNIHHRSPKHGHGPLGPSACHAAGMQEVEGVHRGLHTAG